MTIKRRNRITLVFLIFATIIFLGELGIFLYQFINKTFTIPQVVPPSNSKLFLFKYNPTFVLLAIFIQNIYVVFTTLFTLRAFEKTQTSEIYYFVFFLFACICDSFRIFIPLFYNSGIYSNFFLIIGNICLFARILVPLSLLSTILMNDEDQRQNLERNSIILIIIGAFLADLLPINTSHIESTFLISYSFEKILTTATIFIHISNTVMLITQNRTRKNSQATSIGYFLLSTGNLMMFGCFNLFLLICGFLLLSFGTFLFLRGLHKYFLWND